MSESIQTIHDEEVGCKVQCMEQIKKTAESRDVRYNGRWQKGMSGMWVNDPSRSLGCSRSGGGRGKIYRVDLLAFIVHTLLLAMPSGKENEREPQTLLTSVCCTICQI